VLVVLYAPVLVTRSMMTGGNGPRLDGGSIALDRIG
jgi:hypothetical protein